MEDYWYMWTIKTSFIKLNKFFYFILFLVKLYLHNAIQPEDTLVSILNLKPTQILQITNQNYI